MSPHLVQHAIRLGLAILSVTATAAVPAAADAIHDAAQAGDLAKVRQLVAADPRSVDVIGGFYNYTPLTYAAGSGRITVVRFLLAHGADVNGLSPAPSRSWPLFAAIRSGASDVAVVLIDAGAEVNGTLPEVGKPTLLTCAAANIDLPVVRSLLAHHADPNAVGDEGTSPVLALLTPSAMEMRSEAKLRPVLAELIKADADVNVPSNTDWTPLHSAALNNWPLIAADLLAAGADPAAINSAGKTPWDVAVAKGNTQIAAMLRKATPATRPATP